MPCAVLARDRSLPDSPLEAAARAAADALGARVCHPAFRTAPRPPMSAVPRLSGRDAFPERIRYASRDLVVRERLQGERVLLLDDIRCTGASEAVWGWALTELAGAESVSAISLAQAEGMDPDQPVAEIELEAIRREARTAAGPYRKAFDVAWLEPDAACCTYGKTAGSLRERPCSGGERRAKAHGTVRRAGTRFGTSSSG